MEVIDIADAELRLEELIDKVEEGKSFAISQEGVAVARLIPIPNELEACVCRTLKEKF